MSRFENLPKDVRSKLKTDPRNTSGNELLPAEVASKMRELEDERPIWTASQMESELSTGHKAETVRNKLETLDELGICRSMVANNGRIYWWNDERSKWPIPPDVDVERQELTVKSLLRPWYVKVGLMGLLIPVLAGIPILFGIFSVAGSISIPFSGTELLFWGMLGIIVSYFLIGYAVLLEVIEKYSGDNVDLRIWGR